MSTTIDPQHAADLYDEQDGATAGPWTRVGANEQDPHKRQSRWHQRHWLLLRDADGAFWGLEYGIGLTEDQENDYPWEWAKQPLALTRLYPHTVTTTVYRTKPQEG